MAEPPQSRCPDGAAPDPAGIIAEALDRAAQREQLGVAPPAVTVHGSRMRSWDAISRLRGRARREILSVDDTTYLIFGGVPEEIQQRGPSTLRAAISRGVAVRQVTSRPGLLADRELGAIVYRRGGQARVLPSVPVKMSILDRRIALLPLDSTVLADGFRIIRDPDVVATLTGVHRDLWRTGSDPSPDTTAALPPQLAAVLPALAAGGADEVVARKVGMSPRTYSRRVAELLALLGVRTRFQAGAEAVRRGWL